MPMYMKFGSVAGKVTAKGYEGWIELNSLQFGVSRGIGSPHGTDADRESSAPSISEVVITKQFDKSSNKLFMDAVAGKMDTKVDIKLTTTTKDQTVEFLHYELTAAGISGYSISSGGDRPSESISLNFLKIQITSKGMDSSVTGQPDVVGYDLSTLAKV